MSTPNDIQALLASIRPRPSPPNAPSQDQYQQQRPQQSYPPGMFPPHPQQQQQQPYDGQSYPHPGRHGYHHPSVSSAVHSPSPMNTPPHHGSDILSPNVSTPQGDRGSQHQMPQNLNNPDRAASLLNLLRFSQGPGTVPQPASPVVHEQDRSPPIQETTSPHGRNISASDLVASLFGGQGAAAHAAPPVPHAEEPAHSEGPSENTQDMLLRLLNRSQSGANTAEAPALVAASQPAAPQNLSGEEYVEEDGTEESAGEFLEPSPKAAKPETVAPSASKGSMFTYTNPFEQLAAISPQAKSPQPTSGGHTPVVEAPVVEAVEKTTVQVAAEAAPAPAPAPQPVRSNKKNSEPILEPVQRQALDGVVGRLVDEIGRSLSIGESKLSQKTETVSPTTKEESTEAVISSIASNLRETAAEAKDTDTSDEVTGPETTDMGPATTAALASDNENAEALLDSWESAEDSAEKEEERIVSVHNFPLKPFISITVKPQSGKLATFRDDGIMDIARLKKEFDQLDRSLTAATSEYIVYALAKTGGIRVIRQDDGTDRQVFRSTRDRVFNVALCTAPSSSGTSDEQAILGIGVSGTVYWALISRHSKDLFELDALERESLIFPPFPASDENTSGGQLKTRAKRSTRHPDLFAIGRGKNIYVVSPQSAMNPVYGISGSQRTVNTEKFFKERALKISTGKAGKDFAFSDDDSVIASLDKTGRLRFWDIRDFLENNSTEGPAPNEIRVPLNTFVTGSPAEKSWPTSVLFLDKLRPYSRSMALRYVLVGLKQNHTLQLWDIGLGKAVEEVKFPHENESDAICSVAYHPSSGIIVVGHPTRNSIYFVHLSAPRYNLPPMPQAAFVKAASDKESTLPKPESTACLSGIREISLGSKGQLRSLELLPISKSASDKRDQDTGLFELYVMHSQGVTCLNVKKEDLGWSSDNKVIRPVDGLEEGVIDIADLQAFPSYVTDDPSVNGDAASTLSKATKEQQPAKKTDNAVESTAGVVPSRNASPTKPVKKTAGGDQTENVTSSGSAEKSDKKKKKKIASASSAISEATVKAKEPTATAGVEPLLPSQQSTHPGKYRLTCLPSNILNPLTSTPSAIPTTTPMSTYDLDQHLSFIQTSVSESLSRNMNSQLDSLFRRLDLERRDWDAAASAKQEEVLRLVSRTLSDNVEKNLGRIVSERIQEEILPVVIEHISADINRKLNTLVAPHVSTQVVFAIKNEVRENLPIIVHGALKDANSLKPLADATMHLLAPRLESELSKAMNSVVLPAIGELSRRNQKLESDMERHHVAQIRHLETMRAQDQDKLDEMATMIRSLSNTVTALAANQNNRIEQGNNVNATQVPFARPVERHQNAAQAQVSYGSPHPAVSAAMAPVPGAAPMSTHAPGRVLSSAGLSVPAGPANYDGLTPEQAELAEIAELMRVNRFEDASVKWIRSNQQADLFDNYFIRVNPTYLERLPGVVLLSIGVAVTSSLSTNVQARLNWLKLVFRHLTLRVRILNTVRPYWSPPVVPFVDCQVLSNPRTLQDADLREVLPDIMNILSERLNTLYLRIAERNPNDQTLRLIAPLARTAHDLQVQCH
ncbi:hypothetical protein N7532_009031 [Penicillium argentinense]|uniref:EDC4-like protein pdc1 beta-propeller domain-containing protein n=1 Tax=Penicillium argentinense TaxID=1131581 RepID=A0A9W9K338_9EURO|nr:uncharacterized protein N7532_009031 [Penicillium argentinense]KAJ5090347.1 hypothetical protein N7532_009031 [Penicillium argentinense]